MNTEEVEEEEEEETEVLFSKGVIPLVSVINSTEKKFHVSYVIC